MKKIIVFLCLVVFTISLVSSSVINLKTNPNQGIYLTPIKTTEGHIPIIEREFYLADENGDLSINLDLSENYDLIVEFNDAKKYKKIFRENFDFNSVANLEMVHDAVNRSNFGIVDRFQSDILKDFVVTGYAIYEKNQKIIIPASYLFMGVLFLLFFISVFSKKKEDIELDEEKIKENKEEVESVIDELRKEGSIDIAEKSGVNEEEVDKSEEEGEIVDKERRITQEEIDKMDERVEYINREEGENSKRFQDYN